jgi:hypothetical protein
MRVCNNIKNYKGVYIYVGNYPREETTIIKEKDRIKS